LIRASDIWAGRTIQRCLHCTLGCLCHGDGHLCKPLRCQSGAKEPSSAADTEALPHGNIIDSLERLHDSEVSTSHSSTRSLRDIITMVQLHLVQQAQVSLATPNCHRDRTSPRQLHAECLRASCTQSVSAPVARRVSPRQLRTECLRDGCRRLRATARTAGCLRANCTQSVSATVACILSPRQLRGVSAPLHALRGVSAPIARRVSPRHQPSPRQWGVVSATAAGVQDVSAPNVSATSPRRLRNPQLSPRHQPSPRRQLSPRQPVASPRRFTSLGASPRRPGGASRRLRGSKASPRRFFVSAPEKSAPRHRANLWQTVSERGGWVNIPEGWGR
jgi:hypothetical protein